MEKKHAEDRREPEIVYSRSVKAGRRIYYLDVKKARNEDLYLCITESKKSAHSEAEAPSFEKHKLFLYKEDFSHFVEGLDDVIGYIRDQVGEIEDRPEWVPGEEAAEQAEASDSAAGDESADEPRKLGFFSRLRH